MNPFKMSQNTTTFDTTVSPSIQKTLFNSFDQYGNHAAIKYGDKEYSYKYIDSISNRICHWLLNQNMGNGKHIALYLEDRSSLIIWMIAILKARSVFIPLDYNYPIGRIQQLLDISNCNLVVSDQDGKSRLKSDGNDVLIVNNNDVEGDSELKQGKPSFDQLEYSGEDKIYIYFTSGSTGVPKAIVGKNASLDHFIKWEVKNFGLDKNTNVSQFISPGFDAFLRDVFPALSIGGTICIPDQDFVNSKKLIDWIEDQEINLIHCVPSFFKLFLSEDLNSSLFSNLKYILLSGEKLNLHDLAKWYKLIGDKVQLVNLYGATETTMIKTFYLVQPEDLEKGSIPIGKAIQGTQVFILDENLKPVGKTNAGEIFIRTKYGTHGYYNNPKLNEEKFVLNPYSDDKSDLLYRTGDLGRFNHEGDIEFLGRIDRQVKIRGVRIEPQEIEKELSKHELILEAVIKPFKFEEKDDFLCAYIVVKHLEEKIDLRAYLSQNLPDFMIPEHFVYLSTIPLLPNGKIDVKNLPDPREINKGEILLPETEEQEKMLKLWSDVLERDPSDISIESNFIEIGGNSLKLVFLANNIKKEFNVEVSLTNILEFPTIAKLCHFLSNSRKIDHLEILPAAVKEYYPLSSAQKRMYILNKYDDQSSAYNMTRVATIYGVLDLKKMTQAFHQLISRHESLRTSFELIGEEPVQRVVKDVDFSISVIKDNEEPSVSISKFIKPYELNKAPLLRVGVIKVSSEEHILIVDNHHIISDGLSHSILLRDFMALYAGDNLPDLPLQYKDYAVWQQSEYQKTDYEKNKDFWISEFEDELQTLILPTDYERPLIKNYEGSAINFTIDSDTTDKLRKVSNETGSTLFMTLFTIYNILISKLSGANDVVIGVPVADRQHADLENVIGMLANTLAIRNRVKKEKTVKEFILELKSKVLQCIENQRYPYEELIEELNITRDTSRNPLFDVMFVYNDKDNDEYQLNDLKLERYVTEVRTSKFDLLLGCTESNDQLHCGFEYSTEIFSKETILNFITYFKHLISQVVNSLDITISELNILSDSQKHLLASFNDTYRSYDSDSTIHKLFEDQVLQTPDTVAVTFKGATLSYSDVNKKSNQLAGLLRSKGVTNNTIVGVMQQRSMDMIISILGILKAGGAYLPIDPDYPISRIEQMVYNSGMSLLLSDDDFVGSVIDRVTCLDIRSLDCSGFDSVNLPYISSSSDLLYVIYTSGSTGVPKGVMLNHGNMTNLMDYHINSTSIDTSSVLQFTTLTFDPSFKEIFSALLTGGTVHMIEDSVSKDFSKVLKHIESHAVRTIFMPSSVLNQIFNSKLYQEELPTTLRNIVTAGEQVVVGNLFKQYLEDHEVCLHNHYGPAETHVVTTNTIHPGSGVPTMPDIGKPIQNTQIYILNTEMHLQPVNVAGELYIGGKQVGVGYIQNPELTAERYIDNPYGEGRLYKTGDLARWTSDGSIEFLGRIDDQLKLHGVRIEPGEIESHINVIPEIVDSVVVVNEVHGDKSLIAYYVSTVDLSVSELRNHLLEELPLSMIPGYYVRLSEMPMTSTGKLDRKSLPSPEGEKVAYQAASTPTEKQLVTLWSELLHLESDQLSVSSSFFDLGGNSLRAVVLINMISKLFSVHLVLKSLFKYQDISSLASYIDSLEKESFIAIPKVSSREYYPLSSAQQRMYFLYEFDKDSLAYNTTKVVSLQGVLDKKKLAASFDQLISRHDVFRTSFDFVDGHPVQLVSDSVGFSITYLEKGEDIRDTITDFISPFDLSVGP
ncbi:non-ribosomal peptide synthetase, partial [Aquimarina sediminis]|uniref:non-ribosomal peptide synthetase n=1 Tax=Aquimarina sediminis TaxID=2070536 RepID=UPI000FFEAB5D